MLNYRLRLMHAYFHAKRPQDLQALLQETDAYFHKQGHWDESVASGLGAMCLATQLYTESMAYYKEAISQHQRTQPGRGIGNGVLSGYYAQLARAYAGLGKTAADPIVAGRDVDIISGATYSSKAMALGVKRGALVLQTALKNGL